MELDKLEIRFKYCTEEYDNDFYEDDFFDDEEEYDDFYEETDMTEINSFKPVVKAIDMDDKNDTNQKLYSVAEITESASKKVYNICLSEDFDSVNYILHNSGDYFCSYFGIYYDNKEIGSFCLSRIFVDDYESISVWLDNECPNSMEIGSYVCNDVFELLEGRYIGIIDELILNSDNINNETLSIILNLIYLYIKHLNLNMYHIYTQPKSVTNKEYLHGEISTFVAETYLKLGLYSVNTKNKIMYLDSWHLKNRRNLSGILKQVYLPEI